MANTTLSRMTGNNVNRVYKVLLQGKDELQPPVYEEIVNDFKKKCLVSSIGIPTIVLIYTLAVLIAYAVVGFDDTEIIAIIMCILMITLCLTFTVFALVARNKQSSHHKYGRYVLSKKASFPFDDSAKLSVADPQIADKKNHNENLYNIASKAFTMAMILSIIITAAGMLFLSVVVFFLIIMV